MSKQRKQYTEEFKATVALNAMKGENSLQELAAKYEKKSWQSTWKNSNLTPAPSIGFRYSLKAYASGQKTRLTSLP